jgi:hypothetical protein
MARKRYPAAPAKKAPSRRIATPPSAKPRLAAHPRLIHGFLVWRVARSTTAAADAKPASIAVGGAGARVQRLAAKREGPSDDATFH